MEEVLEIEFTDLVSVIKVKLVELIQVSHLYYLDLLMVD
jgi:hypothetical protein